MTRKKGQHFTLIMPDHPLNGRLVEFVRQSKATGECMVKIVERVKGPNGAAFHPGDVLQVKPHELRNLGKVNPTV